MLLFDLDLDLAKTFASMRSKNDTRNPFILTIDCLKTNIFGYFFNNSSSNGSWYSNRSSDILNLRLCCKDIRRATEQSFLEAALIVWPNEIDKAKVKLIRSIKLSQTFNSPLSLMQFTNLQSLEFPDNFNQPLTALPLLCSIKKIKFGIDFNQPLTKESLPCNLLQLILGNKFNQPLTKDSLPCSLLRLVFGNHYSKPLTKDSLPGSLESLILPMNYSLPMIDGILPESLQELVFGAFRHPALTKESLPRSLRSLTLPVCYNRPLDQGILPESLQILILGNYFRSPLFLPGSLTHLTLNQCFKEPLTKDFFPSSLEILTLSIPFFTSMSYRSFQGLMLDALPISIKQINFGGYYDYDLPIDLLMKHQDENDVSVGRLIFNESLGLDNISRQKISASLEFRWRKNMSLFGRKIEHLELTNKLFIQEQIVLAIQSTTTRSTKIMNCLKMMDCLREICLTIMDCLKMINLSRWLNIFLFIVVVVFSSIIN